MKQDTYLKDIMMNEKKKLKECKKLWKLCLFVQLGSITSLLYSTPIQEGAFNRGRCPKEQGGIRMS